MATLWLHTQKEMGHTVDGGRKHTTLAHRCALSRNSKRGLPVPEVKLEVREIGLCAAIPFDELSVRCAVTKDGLDGVWHVIFPVLAVQHDLYTDQPPRESHIRVCEREGIV